MMNNPVAQLMNVIRTGGDPQALLNSMASRDPQIKQAVQMMSGKTSAQLQQMAQNMARERGISLNDVMRQFGINFPSDK